MIFRLLAAIFAALVLAPPAPAAGQDAITSIPYRIDYGGWLTVSVTVGGRGPYDFIIDTGASQSLVFESLNAVHAFAPSGGPPQEVLGLLSSGKFPTYIIGDVRVGDTVLPDLVSVVLPDWNVAGRAPQGVLGLDFIKQYRMVFDAGKMELRLHPPGGGAALSSRFKRVPLRRADFGRGAGDLFVVDAKLNSRPVPLLLDLGASGTIMNRVALGSIVRESMAVGIRMSGGDAAGRIRDALDLQKEADVVRVARVQAGRAYWYKQIFLVQDSAILRELSVSSVPFGLFGSDLVRDRSFALDLSRDEMFVGPRP